MFRRCAACRLLVINTRSAVGEASVPIGGTTGTPHAGQLYFTRIRCHHVKSPILNLGDSQRYETRLNDYLLKRLSKVKVADKLQLGACNFFHGRHLTVNREQIVVHARKPRG